MAWAAAAYTTGLLAAKWGILPGFILPLALCCAGLLLGAAAWRTAWVRPVTVGIAFLAGGALMWNAHQAGPPGDALSRYVAAHPGIQCTVRGRVRDAGIILPDTAYAALIVDAEHVVHGETHLPLPGRMLVKWPNPEMPVHPGQIVEATGAASTSLTRMNPGVHCAETELRGHGVHSALTADGPDAVAVMREPGTWTPRYWASRLRRNQALALQKAMPPSAFAFAMAVWLGDRQLIDQRQFHLAGVGHILAVSGLHVGVFFVTAAWGLSFFLPQSRPRTLLLMALVLLFALTAGARASALRAALMVVIYLSADLAGRERDVPTALSVSALLFLLLRPTLVNTAGFTLSFLGVASLLVFAEPLARRMAFLPRPVRNGLSTSIGVQVLPLPLAMHYFHTLPFLSPLVNLAAVPLLAVALWLCLLATLTSTVSVSLAAVFGYALWPVASLLQGCVEAAAASGGYLRAASPTPAALALYWAGALCLAWALTRPRWRRHAWTLAVVCAAGAALTWTAWWPPCETVFLDVGQGDATFVRMPNGFTLLIDGGDNRFERDAGRRYVEPFLRSRQVTRLDCVAATHADSDHMGGLLHIVEVFDVGRVLLGPLPSSSRLEAGLLARCAARGIPVRRVAQGYREEHGGSAFEVLHPPADWPADSSHNNASLVIAVEMHGLRLLLPADIETTAENALAPAALRSQVVKVPHHGSATSSSRAFVEAASASEAVVSTGGGYARDALDPAVVARWAASGARVWRTDWHGGVVLRPNPEYLSINSARRPGRWPVPPPVTATEPVRVPVHLPAGRR